MAEFNEIRQVAIEIQKNTSDIKTAVDALKANVDAIHAVVSLWTVNSDDASLPAELDVKAQVEAYEALSTSISKPGNVLTDSIGAVKAAV